MYKLLHYQLLKFLPPFLIAVFSTATVFAGSQQQTDVQPVAMPPALTNTDGSHPLALIPNRSGSALIAITPSPSTPGLLYVNPTNPRYFTDGSGKAIYLTGSHTWANFQDAGTSNPPAAFGYNGYLNFLQANNHNFFRLWAWEQSKWLTGATYYFSPSIYQRPGPGTALDGGKKFDVTKFNQAYFNRMRSRIIAAGNKGIYVSIMLFDGWSVDCAKNGPCNTNANPWRGHPFNSSNNINGINGDPNNDKSGSETHTLQISAITARQKAYIRKVINTVNDLDNVLYEISNESHSNSQAWQYYMIDYIKSYEATKPKQHPIGMTVEYPGGSNSELFSASNHADWVSPNGDTYKTNPDAATGNKVIIVDSDHLWGEGGDRIWVWKSFTRGLNLLFMDCYQASFCTSGVFTPNSPTRLSIVANMGYVRDYADRMNLKRMTPRTSTSACSTQYCLVWSGRQYLVYRPSSSGSVTVNLSAASGQLSYEWFNPATGKIAKTGTTTGGASRTFSSPFSGDAVLYIHK